MARKNMSEEERLEVSNRKRDALAEELAAIKKQTLQAARFIQSCGSTAKAKDIFGMVVTIAEKMS